MSQANSPTKLRVALSLAFALIAALGCGHDTSAPSADALRVQLLVVGDRGNSTFRASVQVRGETTTAAIAGSGPATIATGLNSTDTVVIRIEESVATSPRYHAATAAVTGDGLRQLQRFVLIPRRWTITANTNPCRFAGQAVDVDLRLAYSRSVADPSAFYWRVPNATGGWTYRSESFSAAAMPIPIAFDRAASTDAISAADSVAFWSAVGDLESSLCRNVFQPANVAAVSATRGVRVLLDRTLDAVARGGPTMGQDRGASVIVSGVVVCQSASCLTNGSVPQHELLHVLGFGHTCAWPSVMRAGCAGETRLSPADVAYFQVYYAARALQLATGAQHSLAAAHQGVSASVEMVRAEADAAATMGGWTMTQFSR